MYSYAYISTHKGNKHVKFYEINSLYGHDTFLLDVNNVGAAVKVLDYYVYEIYSEMYFFLTGPSRIVVNLIKYRSCLSKLYS